MGGGAGGGVVGGGVSAVGGGVSTMGGRKHPTLKAREKISIRGTTICFIFTLFIAGSIIALESS